MTKWDKAIRELTIVGWNEGPETIEAELQRRLVPLLELLDQKTCSALCKHRDCSQNREELSKWLIK